MTERDPYGLKPGKQGRAGGHSHGRGKLAQPPRPINFRRRWDHGKDLDDPVYPTMKIPAALMPLFPQDWRSAGRALLCLGMAMLEGIRLRSKGATLKWQKAGYCSALCQEQCAKSPNRIFCAWRVQNTVHDHHNRLDGALLSYKGVVHYDDPKKPIYRILNQVALKNRYKSERMVWDTSQAAYIFADREEIHPGFGIRPDRDESHYAPDEETYDSDSDLEASSADEDSDGEGRACSSPASEVQDFVSVEDPLPSNAASCKDSTRKMMHDVQHRSCVPFGPPSTCRQLGWTSMLSQPCIKEFAGIIAACESQLMQTAFASKTHDSLRAVGLLVEKWDTDDLDGVRWEWPLEGKPADMTDALLQTVVKEIKSAAGCTEYKAKVKLMEANFSQRGALTLISHEQRMMEQEANERFEELKQGLKQMHQQQLQVDNFLEDLEYVCCESFVCHEEEICLRVLKGERLKLYYQDPLESDYLEHAGEGWAYVGFKDNEHTHGWIPQECMQVAVRSPKKRVQWQRYKVRESWFAQKHHDIDGYLRVNKGDTIEMLETVEAEHPACLGLRY
ncbi:unnamed protein product [Symbiodinium sp. CCMP2456]|nr:unnamed protein product [Symbiodinium sp. CCMP2456]